jgi:hypothetical protein
MTPARQSSSAMGWALLAVLIATLLGHVCVLPLHAHAAATTTDQHGHGSDTPDQAAHIGSCEALASSPIVHSLAVVSSTAEWAASPLEAVTWVAPDRVAAPPPKSTPLFLLHASLLI